MTIATTIETTIVAVVIPADTAAVPATMIVRDERDDVDVPGHDDDVEDGRGGGRVTIVRR